MYLRVCVQVLLSDQSQRSILRASPRLPSANYRLTYWHFELSNKSSLAFIEVLYLSWLFCSSAFLLAVRLYILTLALQFQTGHERRLKADLISRTYDVSLDNSDD